MSIVVCTGANQSDRLQLSWALATGEKMRTGVHLVEETTEVPESFESFEEYRAFLLEYRDLLARIVRLTASLLPEQALEAAARRLRHSLGVCSTSGTSIEVCPHSHCGTPSCNDRSIHAT